VGSFSLRKSLFNVFAIASAISEYYRHFPKTLEYAPFGGKKLNYHKCKDYTFRIVLWFYKYFFVEHGENFVKNESKITMEVETWKPERKLR
jgi:hypothetical protein